MRSGRITRLAMMFLATLLALSTARAAPGSPPSTAPVPGSAFAPFDMHQDVNRYRSANGMPGPDYWQNRADYAIHVTLDTESKVISGTTDITYTNNSPDTLEVLWLQLDQNLYKPGSRGALARGGMPGGHTDGMTLDSVKVAAGRGRATDVTPLISDTRARLRLPQPLLPGAVAKISIAYHYQVPPRWGGRTSWGPSRDGVIHDIAQWYPRMAVYDDIRGWDTAPYLAQEFYLEYGDFDYWVTVPADMLVAGSGELQNPRDVLTKTQIERLKQARNSDATVMIRSPEEITDPSTRPTQRGTLTWHYRMENTRDVAFSASSTFAWDAARANLPGGGSTLAMSFYPAESAGTERWGRSTEYLKDALERFSSRWYPYPWPAAVNVAGPTSGMEYPGILFDGIDDAGRKLFWITAHEIGHSWFPMIVGVNERRNAWMDEGLNTFIDVYESDDFNGGEYGPKRDSEYAEGGGNPVDEILPVLADPTSAPILSRADTIIEQWRHPVTYFKTALGLVLLREQILGPERFDPAFRRFIEHWAFRHPQPADFFRAMESDAGEDLSYFWRGWFEHNWQLDLAVDGVKYVEEDPAKGALVTVATRARLILPATLHVEHADGSTADIRLPAETFIRRNASDIPVPGGTPIVRAELDPDHRIPDRDRSNNLFVGG